MTNRDPKEKQKPKPKEKPKEKQKEKQKKTTKELNQNENLQNKKLQESSLVEPKEKKKIDQNKEGIQSQVKNNSQNKENELEERRKEIQLFNKKQLKALEKKKDHYKNYQTSTLVSLNNNSNMLDNQEDKRGRKKKKKKNNNPNGVPTMKTKKLKKRGRSQGRKKYTKRKGQETTQKTKKMNPGVSDLLKNQNVLSEFLTMHHQYAKELNKFQEQTKRPFLMGIMSNTNSSIQDMIGENSFQGLNNEINDHSSDSSWGYVSITQKNKDQFGSINIGVDGKKGEQLDEPKEKEEEKEKEKEEKEEEEEEDSLIEKNILQIIEKNLPLPRSEDYSLDTLKKTSKKIGKLSKNRLELDQNDKNGIMELNQKIFSVIVSKLFPLCNQILSEGLAMGKINQEIDQKEVNNEKQHLNNHIWKYVNKVVEYPNNEKNKNLELLIKDFNRIQSNPYLKKLNNLDLKVSIFIWIALQKKKFHHFVKILINHNLRHKYYLGNFKLSQLTYRQQFIKILKTFSHQQFDLTIDFEKK
ncbi:hypothetical protein M0813_22421 [Anaeramoeba flamelloides]|uniref:RUN domain-containing protein n=1 Tax=Anaeramoeba flamelloides TaxID=1746091 RepID=A0ABQ8YFI3_9EUKA|nr:hypothetical protein M0813_22421 [Anaeramoeba flamelloides]